MERHLESQLDAKALSSRRWVTSRVQSGRTTVDTIEQPSPGSIEVVRRRTGRPDEGHRFVRKQPVLDPLGFLYWIRNRPPQTPQAYEVLDGRALWLITVEPARGGAMDKGRAALMVRGQANPIFWDGQRDPERAARSFTLWLDTDPLPHPSAPDHAAAGGRGPGRPGWNPASRWRRPPPVETPTAGSAAADAREERLGVRFRSPLDQAQRQSQQVRPAPQRAWWLSARRARHGPPVPDRGRPRHHRAPAAR